MQIYEIELPRKANLLVYWPNTTKQNSFEFFYLPCRQQKSKLLKLLLIIITSTFIYLLLYLWYA